MLTRIAFHSAIDREPDTRSLNGVKHGYLEQRFGRSTICRPQNTKYISTSNLEKCMLMVT